MAGLPGLPEPGFLEKQGLPGLPAPGFLGTTGGTTPTLNSVSGEIGKGLTFGFFDELQGLEAGAQNAVRGLFGLGNGKSFADNYGAKVKEMRAQDSAFESANPKTAAALQIAGGLLPALSTAGASTAPAGAGALSTLFGVGLKEAPTLKQLATMGAAGGALFGAGEANNNGRLFGAIKGAAIGSVAAPIIGKTTEYGIRALADAAANNGLTQKLASEAGSVLGGAGAPNKLSPGEMLLAKELRNVPVEQVRKGASELAQTVDQNIPLFLPEAIGSAKIDRNARFVANYEPSMDFSQEAIQGRTNAAASRAAKILRSVSPSEDSFTGASRMAKAADEIIQSAEGNREALAFPLYNKAYKETPVINSPALGELLSKDKALSQAISSVKKTANNAELPDNSAQILVKARQEIGNQIDSAVAQGMGRKARDLTDTYNRLNEILHKESPLLADADNAFSAASTGIDEMTGTFLSNLQKITDDKVMSVGQIFNLPANRIEDLRARFDNAGKLSEWNAGIRAFLQSSIDKSPDGRNFVEPLLGNEAMRSKLKAALGGAYDSVSQGLNYESRMFKGRNKYNAGSTTAGNLQEAEAFKKGVGLIQNMKEGNWMKALASLFSSDMPESTAQELARIYFDPRIGSKKLQSLMPILEQYAKNKQVAGVAGNLAGVASRDSSYVVPSQGRQPLQGLQQRRQSLQQQTEKSETPGAMKLVPSPNSAPIQRSTQAPINQDTPASYPGNALFSIRKTMDSGKPPVAQIEQQIDQDPFYSAVYEAESGRNPAAKNPRSTAAGGFQLIKATAKALGVEDPLDLAQNFEGFKKLTAENQARFGDDPRMLYSAHFLGAPLLAKVLSGAPLSESEQAIVNELRTQALPRFEKIYTRIANKGVVQA